MNIGFSLAFLDGTKYYAFETVEIGGKQYAGKVIAEKSSTSFRTVLSVDGDYQPSNMTIAIDNENRSFYAIINSATNKNIYGVEATLRDISNNIIWVKFIESWRFDTVNENIVINISDFYGDINNKLPGKYLNEEEYPNLNTDALDLPIPFLVGNWNEPVAGAMQGEANLHKCWYVGLDATYEYLIGQAGDPAANTITKVACYNPAGADITANCTFVQHPTDKRWYITLNIANVDYIVANFTYDDVTPSEMIDDVAQLFNNYTFDVSEISGLLDTDTAPRGYNDTPLAFNRYAVIEDMTGRDILKELCENYTTEYYIDKNKAIVYKILDATNSLKYTIPEAKILHFQYGEEKTDEIYNKFNINTLYYWDTGSHTVSLIYNKQESIDDNNITRVKKINTKCFVADEWTADMKLIFHPFVTAKYYGIYHSRDAWIPATILVDLDEVKNNSLDPGDIIKFSHPKVRTTSQRKYRIQSIEWSFHQDKAIIGLRDVDFTDSIRTADKLLIQSNTYNGSTWPFDEAAGNDTRIQFVNGLKHSTAQTKFGKSSILFVRGSTQYALMKNNWNVTLQTNATIEFWIRLVSNGNFQALFHEWKDNTHFDLLHILDTNEIRFIAQEAGANIVILTGATALAANTWYHILLAKVGIEWGIYLNGAQDAYLSDNSTHTITGNNSYLGRFVPSALYYLDAYVPCARFSYDNVFGAAPNNNGGSGDDTITVPTRMLRDTGF